MAKHDRGSEIRGDFFIDCLRGSRFGVFEHQYALEPAFRGRDILMPGVGTYLCDFAWQEQVAFKGHLKSIYIHTHMTIQRDWDHSQASSIILVTLSPWFPNNPKAYYMSRALPATAKAVQNQNHTRACDRDIINFFNTILLRLKMYKKTNYFD